MAALAARVAEDFPTGELALLAPLVRRRKGFHKDVIAAAAQAGLAEVRIDGALHPAATPPRARPLPDPRRRGAGRPRRASAAARASSRARSRARSSSAAGRWWPWRGGGERFYSTRRACPSCGTGLPAPDPRLFSWSQKYGACPECEGFGAPRVEEDGELRRAEGVACPACAGTRLRPEARAVRIAGRHIGEVSALTLRELRALARQRSRAQLPEEVRERVWPELVLRLDLLDRLGLSLPDARPRGRHALDRRGAAHPDRGGARLQPARRLLRARRADHRPAPARQRGAHAGAPRRCATAATRWSWSSTRRA